MSKLKVELNVDAIRDQLLKSDEMKNICLSHANKALQKLGPGYEVSSYTGINRVNASIMAVTYQAKKDNYENNTILKSLG